MNWKLLGLAACFTSAVFVVLMLACALHLLGGMR